MNIRGLLLILIGIGILLLGLGLYLVFNSSNSSQQNSSANASLTPVINTQSIPVSSSKKITVPANVMWYDTGIDVSQTVSIKYLSGRWTNGGNEPIWTDADGSGTWNSVILPGAPFRGLIGKVKSNVFFAGGSYEGSPGNGRLYLSINDIPGTFSDNKGEIVVMVDSR